MARYIDANKLQERLTQIANEPDYQHEGENWSVGVCLAGLQVDDMPTEDVQEVKHGELKDIADFGNGICIGYCSHCGTEHRGKNPSLLIYSYKYCRWCGAKMDGDVG